MTEQRITIILKPDGQVSVNAPMQNKDLCYELLKIAERLIKEYKSQIIIPSMASILKDNK